MSALWAVISAGSVLRFDELVVKLDCLRMGVAFAGVASGLDDTGGEMIVGVIALMVCASMLGWYGKLVALWFGCNGVLPALLLFRGDTNGLVSVFELSFSFLRLTVSGDDIVVSHSLRFKKRVWEDAILLADRRRSPKL